MNKLLTSNVGPAESTRALVLNRDLRAVGRAAKFPTRDQRSLQALGMSEGRVGDSSLDIRASPLKRCDHSSLCSRYELTPADTRSVKLQKGCVVHREHNRPRSELRRYCH